MKPFLSPEQVACINEGFRDLNASLARMALTPEQVAAINKGMARFSAEATQVVGAFGVALETKIGPAMRDLAKAMERTRRNRGPDAVRAPRGGQCHRRAGG